MHSRNFDSWHSCAPPEARGIEMKFKTYLVYSYHRKCWQTEVLATSAKSAKEIATRRMTDYEWFEVDSELLSVSAQQKDEEK
jgi:hypothetical protein